MNKIGLQEVPSNFRFVLLHTIRHGHYLDSRWELKLQKRRWWFWKDMVTCWITNQDVDHKNFESDLIGNSRFLWDYYQDIAEEEAFRKSLIKRYEGVIE